MTIALPSLAFFKSELFHRVQMSGMFQDSKTFADAIPKSGYHHVLTAYKQQKNNADFALNTFVQQHFDFTKQPDAAITFKHPDINNQIMQLWPELTRQPDAKNHSSLLPLPYSYIVPGGRFQEIYYWDTYFTALGLVQSNQIDIAENMLANFCYLQQTYGCIPNGNRSYYLSRSQPPILALMVDLLLPFQKQPLFFIEEYYSALETEYQFWMKGKPNLSSAFQASEHVVRLADNCYLNRYFDSEANPRPESYAEDVQLAAKLPTSQGSEFYRNIRSACESGWDFSSRWLAKADDLSSIITTELIPVDLNCLLYFLEAKLAQYAEMLDNKQQSYAYQQAATQRKTAIQRYLWHPNQAFFVDYHWTEQQPRNTLSLAGCFTLFVNLASAEQAKQIAQIIEQNFLKQGGLITTLNTTEQQWDSPNGWAPLQWITIKGLFNYQQQKLAKSISQNWLHTVKTTFENTGVLLEKYNVIAPEKLADGGEYQVQTGFGWTNGVTQALLNLS